MFDIDLRRAFDTVWRDGLFYVLLKHNFPIKLFNVIFSMYQNTNCRIKFQNGITHAFPSTCGVKQGDVLSPILFNLYINGLIQDLNQKITDPVVVEDVTLSALLYADDIILLSETEEGLQNSINVLQTFCSSWKLEVNTQKIKNYDF